MGREDAPTRSWTPSPPARRRRSHLAAIEAAALAEVEDRKIAKNHLGVVLDRGLVHPPRRHPPHRLVTPALWRALVCRDRHCAFPGCTKPPVMGHAHHLTHWADGGTTALTNLVLLCGHHHRTVHHTPWRVRLNPATADRSSCHHPDPGGTSHRRNGSGSAYDASEVVAGATRRVVLTTSR